MTSDLQPYSEYKDTGLPWLGKVPKHWECLPHRSLFKEIQSQGHVDEPLLSVTISKGVIRQSDLLANTSKKDSSNLDKSKYKLVEPEDIAYNKMRAWQGSIGVSRYRGIVSPAYIVVRLRTRQNPEYFHDLFRTPGFAKEAERWSYGITSDQWSLRSEHFKMIYSCLPPRAEQDGIVSFIRHLDKKVNRFIRNRRRLIEVLNEQKQAIINQAVTRGINPNAPLKPSGIDWLGDVPDDWTLKRFKHVVRIRSGQIDPKKVQYQNELLIAPEHIEKGTGVLLQKQSVFDQGAISGKYLVKAGEVIYSKIRPALRKAVIAPCDCLCGADMYPLQPTNEILPKYLHHIILSPRATQYLVYCSMRVAMPKVNRDSLGDLWLCYPDCDTQAMIIEYIAVKIAPLNLATQKAQDEIDLIREYRTRLIADVVTGKVDVRGLAPAELLSADELIDDSVDDDQISEDDEPELVEEAVDTDN